MININPKAIPFVKWVGGKRQLLKEIEKRMPKRFKRYFEPFVGGGATLFHLQHETSFISDKNGELINLYMVIRDRVEELIEDLKRHENVSDYFYYIRNLDRDRESFSKLSEVERASRFLYLNKSGFNGLYRVNSRGEVNISYGDYKNPLYGDSDNLRRCSKLLKGVDIREGDFELFREDVQKGDFFYFDPPYFPINVDSFLSYTEDGFTMEDRKRLLEFAKYIDSRGGKFMISDSCCRESLEFYRGFWIEKVDVKRLISGDRDSRGYTQEILVRNYGVTGEDRKEQYRAYNRSRCEFKISFPRDEYETIKRVAEERGEKVSKLLRELVLKNFDDL